MAQAAAPKATRDSNGELNEQHEGETYFRVIPVQTHAVILQQEKIQALLAHKGIVLGNCWLVSSFWCILLNTDIHSFFYFSCSTAL